MGQTGTIAFALILGFVVFITVRGELPTYLGVIGLGNVNVKPSSTATVSNPAGSGEATVGGGPCTGFLCGIVPTILGH